MGLLQTLSFISNHPLSRGHILRNFGRLVSWQIGGRLVPGPVAFDFVNSSRLLVQPGMTGATGNIYVGLQDFEDMTFICHFLRPHDLFVDIGANIGAYTVLASAAAGSECIAFEPGEAAFQWLTTNVALNGIAGHVSLRPQALGARVGEALLSVGMDTVNHIVEGREVGGNARPVPITTLDHALDGRRPIMLKMDVEGFETAVLDGAPETLNCPELRCMLIELNGSGVEYGFDEQALRERIAGHGFRESSYRPFERQLAPREPGCKSDNVLYVRDLCFVESRVRTAPAIHVRGLTI